MSKRMTPQKLAKIRYANSPISPNVPGAWSNLVNALLDHIEVVELDLANARSGAIEAAAITAETVTHAPNYDPGPPDNSYSHGFNMGRHAAAEAIRALASASARCIQCGSSAGHEKTCTNNRAEAGVGIEELARAICEAQDRAPISDVRWYAMTGSPRWCEATRIAKAILAKLEPTVAAIWDEGFNARDAQDGHGRISKSIVRHDSRQIAEAWRKSISGDTDV